MLGQIAWNVNSSSILVAIPLFVMMGEVLIHSRLSERLYQVLSHWLAPLPGGLLHSNIAFCAVFGAISGLERGLRGDRRRGGPAGLPQRGTTTSGW